MKRSFATNSEVWRTDTIHRPHLAWKTSEWSWDPTMDAEDTQYTDIDPIDPSLCTQADQPWQDFAVLKRARSNRDNKQIKGCLVPTRSQGEGMWGLDGWPGAACRGKKLSSHANMIKLVKKSKQKPKIAYKIYLVSFCFLLFQMPRTCFKCTFSDSRIFARVLALSRAVGR